MSHLTSLLTHLIFRLAALGEIAIPALTRWATEISPLRGVKHRVRDPSSP